MTLPDWGGGIMDQVETFLGWDAVADMVKLLVGVSVGSILLSLFMRVFFRG